MCSLTQDDLFEDDEIRPTFNDDGMLMYTHTHTQHTPTHTHTRTHRHTHTQVYERDGEIKELKQRLQVLIECVLL